MCIKYHYIKQLIAQRHYVTCQLEYGRVGEVSYWVGLALGQGEFPRDPSLSHVKWMKWLGHRAHDQMMAMSPTNT